METRTEQAMEPGSATRIPQVSISAALAAANAGGSSASALRFPGDDGGHSLAEMAQRDLDAALQLLADRAQYITGATGAAIALRRDKKNDMLCRASTGSNAPELGALLSAEFGLSGESVRTRLPLRCDDAERDARVNREGCRQLGIASVVVMPVVNDDEVLGVFELFSGKVNAFGERDMSALQRLSEMVETAVKLAQAAEGLPEHLMAPEVSAAEPAATEEDILEIEVAPVEVVTEVAALEAPLAASIAPVIDPPPAVTVAAPSVPVPAVQDPPKKPLFWSAALNTAEIQPSAEVDESKLPRVLRNLHKCKACGFPVSEGRLLCVECEEKKWRGQLRVPRPVALAQPPNEPAVALTPARSLSEAVARTAAAAAPAKVVPAKIEPAKIVPDSAAPAVDVATIPAPTVASPSLYVSEVTAPAPTPQFSGGLAASESWFSANKYILGAILVVAAVVAAVVFLR